MSMKGWTAIVLALLMGCCEGVPHIVFVLHDDLGYNDLGYANSAAREYTGNMTRLAEEGLILDRHYVHYWCSPTRRSFLSGRLPVHHGETLSQVRSDSLDLRQTLLPAKLKQGGYATYAFGKGHTGFASMGHLYTERGADGFMGFLSGAQDYETTDRWQDAHPAASQDQFDNPCDGCRVDMYSTTLYSRMALQALEAHDADKPFFLYLAMQAPHTPYDAVPGNPYGNDDDSSVYKGMLWAEDVAIGALVEKLKEKGMWENTLMVVSSDNGGTREGSNYPLRGQKSTSWEGGVRGTAFVSGGFLPSTATRRRSGVNIHIADWYTTLCGLAGVNATDDPPVAPLPVDPSNPQKDIYGSESFPPVDGVDMWEHLLNPAAPADAAHQYLTVTRQSIVAGNWKLLVGQGGTGTNGNNGWKQPDGSWVAAPDADWPCNLPVAAPDTSILPVPTGPGMCLFNLDDDPSEQFNVAASFPDVVSSLWASLNDSVLSWRDCQGWLGPVHGPEGSCSPPSLLGNCDARCARRYWRINYPGSSRRSAPTCGVSGC